MARRLLGGILIAFLLLAITGESWAQSCVSQDFWETERARVIQTAEAYLEEGPITVTAARSKRSRGARNEYYSEGDYWWPNPNNPNGPYVQRDGLTNPDNFLAHRRAIMRLAEHVPSLVAAWKLTGDRRYSLRARRHLRAWFVDKATAMRPHLKYSQAVFGRAAGRPFGIVDSIHLVEVVQAIKVLDRGGEIPKRELAIIKSWFRQYLGWLVNGGFGKYLARRPNNQATSYYLQVLSYAQFVADKTAINFAIKRLRTFIVPNQIAPDGSLPIELGRTKPYNYSFFNLEVLATAARIAQDLGYNLWRPQTRDRRGIGRAVQFMYPYIADKSSWPFGEDRMYFEAWPVRANSLLFLGVRQRNADLVGLWSTLPSDSSVEEIRRNWFIREPVLWVSEDGLDWALCD